MAELKTGNNTGMIAWMWWNTCYPASCLIGSCWRTFDRQIFNESLRRTLRFHSPALWFTLSRLRAYKHNLTSQPPVSANNVTSCQVFSDSNIKNNWYKWNRKRRVWPWGIRQETSLCRWKCFLARLCHCQYPSYEYSSLFDSLYCLLPLHPWENTSFPELFLSWALMNLYLPQSF